MDRCPLIAVTSSEMRSSALTTVPEADPPRDEMVLGLRYLHAISQAGCLPVVVAPVGPDAVDALLDRVDGLCLSGGPDLDPATYGAAPHPRLGPTEPELDRFELALTRAADARGVPILAICRGMQVLDVARSGTLHQHLPDVVGDEVEHRQANPGGEPSHGVELEGPGLLHAVLGDDVIAVNSFHHQAIDRLGDGLRVVGRAPDGTIEAVEDVTGRFVVGVQWHAESLVHRPEHARLFDAFARACGPRGRLTARAA